MRALEPGESGEIQFGNGRTLTVFALSYRQELDLARIEDKGRKAATAEEKFLTVEKALRIALYKMPDDEFQKLLDTLSLKLMMEITRKVNGLSEDDEKKSESPH